MSKWWLPAGPVAGALGRRGCESLSSEASGPQGPCSGLLGPALGVHTWESWWVPVRGEQATALTSGEPPTQSWGSQDTWVKSWFCCTVAARLDNPVASLCLLVLTRGARLFLSGPTLP